MPINLIEQLSCKYQAKCLEVHAKIKLCDVIFPTERQISDTSGTLYTFQSVQRK